MIYEKGNALLITVISVALLALLTGIYFWRTGISNTPNSATIQVAPVKRSLIIPTPTITQNQTQYPSETPKPQGINSCNCSVTMWNFEGNQEFIIANQTGQATGYSLTNMANIQDIPSSSYSWQGGITNQQDTTKSISGSHFLQLENPNNGKYTLQVFSKSAASNTLVSSSGSYQIVISVHFETGNEKQATISGNLATNQTDRYLVSIPDLTLEKIKN